MVWFLLLLMVTCAASSGPTNLGDQVFIFPKQTGTHHVKLHSCIHTFSAVTVCLRVKTDLCSDHSLFSAATANKDNAFLIYWNQDHDNLEVSINNNKVEFKGLKYDRNKWHSICVTWDSATGLVQLWIDGHRTIKEYVSNDLIDDLCIILGQEQDNYCGGFDQHQSFVGEISDVHVWDYILETCEIQHYLNYQNFCPGNAVNWRHLSFHLTGGVVIGHNQICPQDCLENVFPKLSHSDYFKYYIDYYHSRDHSHGRQHHGPCCDDHGHGHHNKGHGHHHHGHGHHHHGYGYHHHGHNDNSHGHNDKGHGHNDKGHGHHNKGHGHNDNGHGHNDKGHGHNDKGHGHHDKGHGHNDKGHGHHDKGHGHHDKGHGHNDNGHSHHDN